MKHFLSLILLVSTVFAFAQKESFTVMTYNLMYYQVFNPPCSHTVSQADRDEAFKTIFKAADPDILCVNELAGYSDNSAAEWVLDHVLNTDGESDFASANYSNNSFSSITNMIFFDTTRFGLDAQNHISRDINNSTLPRVIDFYRMYYKEPGLKLGADTTFFTVAVAHLKAGSSTSDRNDRETAAEAVMDYISNNISDENVLLAGDLNIYGSTEPAYSTFTNYSVAGASFVDPGVPGSWNNNSTYAILHTQSTHSSSSGCFVGGGLDDRFDFLLHSQAIANGSNNLNYKANSLEAFGNDGNHFNQNINAGANAAVSSAVADALYDFSDHLPLLAEYEVEVSGLGAKEYRAQNLISCPNPFSDQLPIKRMEGSTTLHISITNLSGKKVYQQRVLPAKTETSINTASWTSGIYFLTVTDLKGRFFTTKLIKESDGAF